MLCSIKKKNVQIVFKLFAKVALRILSFRDLLLAESRFWSYSLRFSRKGGVGLLKQKTRLFHLPSGVRLEVPGVVGARPVEFIDVAVLLFRGFRKRGNML